MAIQNLQDRRSLPGHDRDPSGEVGDRVDRFGRTERFLHWWIVAMFGAAMLTGIAMGDDAESGSLLTLHIGAVVLVGMGIVLAVVIGDTMAVLRSTKDLFIFDRTDLRFVAEVFTHRGPAIHMRWGKFNIGQKVLAWTLVGSVVAIIVTGTNSWSAGAGASGPHAAAVAVSLALLGAHVFMALVNPSTRPALAGMVLGHVRRTWAATHHSAWLDEQDRRRSARSGPH